MNTETVVAPVVAPAAPISARPPTDLHPTKQNRPTPPAKVQAPTTPKPAALGPDLSKVPGSPISPEAGLKQAQESMKAGIKKLFNPEPPKVEPKPEPVATEPKKAEPAPAAAPAEPAKAVAEPTDRFSDIAEPESLSDAGKKGWKALKTKADTDIKAAEQKLADAQAQLEILRKATPAEIAEVELLKKDRQAALDRLAVLDLQNHPDFTRQYTEPKAKAIADATEVLAYNGKPGIDPVLLGKTQKEFAAAVSEMTKDMNPMDANTVQTAMRSAYKIAGEEKAALAQSGELRAGIEAKNAAQTKKAFEEVYGKLGFENLISPKEAPANASAEEKAQVAEYNQALSGTRALAEKNAFGRLSPKDAAAVATKAAYLDVIVKHVLPKVEMGYSALMAERDAYAKELKEIKGLKSPGSFTAPAEADAEAKKDAKYYLKKAFHG